MLPVRQLSPKACRLAVAVSLVGSCLALTAEGMADAFTPGTGRSETNWNCWYSVSGFKLQCIVRTEANPEMLAPSANTVDGRRAGTGEVTWNHPDSLVGLRAEIPLWNAPIEMDRVRRLAKAVLCGRVRNCTVEFDPNQDGLAPVRFAANLANLNNPAP